jgi:hypothetical protein
LETAAACGVRPRKAHTLLTRQWYAAALPACARLFARSWPLFWSALAYDLSAKPPPYNLPVCHVVEKEGSAMNLELSDEKRQLLLLLVSSRISELHSEIRRCQVFNASESLKQNLHDLQEVQEQLKSPVAHEVE